MSAEEVIGIRVAVRDRAAAAKDLRGTAADVDQIGDAAERAGRKSRGALDVLGKFGSVVGRAAKLGALGVTALGIAGVVAGVKVAASNEQASISFTTMLGSAQKAGSFIKDLQTFAARTPFEFAGLQQSASSLISAGINADKVIPIMTSLGNATAGMGTGAEGIQRATVALQQMNAAGKISAEDLNQLRDAGVPVYDLLSKATGKSTEKIMDMVQAGQLGKKELGQLMDALESGKGLERFNGLMDKQSQSVAGMWSTVQDTVSQGLGRAFAPWVPTLRLALMRLSQLAGPFFDQLTTWSTDLSVKGPWAVNTVYEALLRSKTVATQFVAALRGGASPELTTGFAQVGAGIHAIATGVAGIDWSKVGASAQANLPVVSSSVAVLGVVTGFLAGHLGTLAKWMPVIIAGFLVWRAASALQAAATIASLPVEAAHVLALVMSANAQRMLAIAIAQANGQTIASRAQVAAQLVVLAAQKVAMVASAAWTGIVTAAQWAWNAALTANPIGLVVLGIAALIAGVLLVVHHFGGWHKTIDLLWDKLKKLGGWLKKWGGMLLKFSPIGIATSVATGNGLPKLPGRATGGPVTKDHAYVVGEHRPEVFVPHQSGVIQPTTENLTDGMDGALTGVIEVHSHIYLDGKPLTESVVRQVRREVARM